MKFTFEPVDMGIFPLDSSEFTDGENVSIIGNIGQLITDKITRQAGLFEPMLVGAKTIIDRERDIVSLWKRIERNNKAFWGICPGW